jgi:O-antigen/teichoic acid export membrane protein
LSFRSIVLGTAAMSSVNVLRILAQVLVIPILSRLLLPSDYGIVGIAMPMVLFVMMLADAGIGMSLVRTPATEREEWSTCFWLSAIFGFVLAAFVVGIAPIVAMVFSEASLSPILMALAAVILLQALFLIPRAAQQQRHQFTVIAGTEIAAIAGGIGTALVIAVLGGGAWALVGQQLAFYIIRLSLTSWLTPFRPMMRFHLHRAREHLVFGRNVLSNNVVAFFTQSIDNLVIGKALGVDAVGMYSMAFQFARLPMMLIAGPLQYVLYAQLARKKDDQELLRQTFFTMTMVLAIVVVPTVGIVAVAHEPVFKLLLSERWASAGRLFMIVAPACAVQAVTAIGGTIRMVLGRTDIVLRMTLEFGVIRVITLLVSVWFGLEWAAISYSCAVLMYSPRSLMLVLPIIGGSVRSYLQAVGIPIIVTLTCIASFVEIRDATGIGDWSQLFLGAVLAFVGVVGSAFPQRKGLLGEIERLRETAFDG